MTSERLLLGRSKQFQLKPDDFFGINPRRTSKPEKWPGGFSEPTATIVWGALLRLGLKPAQFVLWNAFPWHSFDPRRGMLSNRMPNKSERAAGLVVLKAFLELFRCDQVVALGKSRLLSWKNLMWKRKVSVIQRRAALGFFASKSPRS